MPEAGDGGAFFLIIGIGMMIMAIAGMVFFYFFVDLLIRNIVPLAIGIVLVLTIPSVAKNYFAKRATRGTKA